MDRQTMWVDVARCTGCGLCIEVCPTEAMAMVEGKAHVDQETCIGCGACVDECAVDAIQPVIQGEIVPVPERPAPTVYRPSPLAETAGAAAAVAGTGLLMKVASALARTVERWLTRRPVAQRAPRSSTGGSSSTRGTAGSGRQTRRRKRGGRD
jgi:ferredoxin